VNLYDKALEEAVNTALSDLGGLTPEEIVEHLEAGEIPEGVAVWSPFEYYNASNLLEVIEGFAAQFERFAGELLLGIKVLNG
jgi:hypothetical protein